MIILLKKKNLQYCHGLQMETLPTYTSGKRKCMPYPWQSNLGPLGSIGIMRKSTRQVYQLQMKISAFAENRNRDPSLKKRSV